MEYKGYTIESDRVFGMYQIKKIGKGSAPKTLRGAYTNVVRAQRAIDAYKPAGVEKHGKEHTTA